MTIANCCYICNDDNPTLQLIESPCQQCKLNVHTHCFDKHQLHQFESFKCALVNTGEDAHPFVVYTSCSICKKRFEYFSPLLIQTLIQQFQNNPSESLDREIESIDEEDNIQSDIQLVVRGILHIVHMIPPYLHNDAYLCAHKIMLAISQAPVDNIISSIEKIFQCAHIVLFVMATCGVILGGRALQYAFQY